MEPNFIAITSTIEDCTVLEVDPSHTNNIISGDVLVLDLKIDAGIG